MEKPFQSKLTKDDSPKVVSNHIKLKTMMQTNYNSEAESDD